MKERVQKKRGQLGEQPVPVLLLVRHNPGADGTSDGAVHYTINVTTRISRQCCPNLGKSLNLADSGAVLVTKFNFWD